MVFFSKEHIKIHNKKDDCWIIVYNKVYDITNFLKEHPGGYFPLSPTQ